MWNSSKTPTFTALIAEYMEDDEIPSLAVVPGMQRPRRK
jgi:hypothetical protein